MSKQTVPMLCGITGLLCLFSPLLMDIPAKYTLWKQSQQVQVSEGIERQKISERAETSKISRQSKQALPGRTLKMAAYIYTPNELPTISTKGYLDTDTIYIYDSTGFCFAKYENRQIKYIKEFPQICN